VRIADWIFERLAKEASCAYFVPGGGAMYLVDALGLSQLKHVSCIHEQAAGFAALAHGMLGEIGVCLTTAGPGATNAITACAAAWMDSVPVIFISGQAKGSTLVGESGLRTRGVQEIDIVSMVTAITKYASQPGEPNACRWDLERMIHLCRHGRPGPCWLSVPQDLQGATCEDQ
jgi:acetolactate synthase-1/2/3 large subunit